jgi:hypothetical protein
MNAIATGSVAIGSTDRKVLRRRGTRSSLSGRKSGDNHADISDRKSLKAIFIRIGSFDAVANAAGRRIHRVPRSEHR